MSSSDEMPAVPREAQPTPDVTSRSPGKGTQESLPLAAPAERTRSPVRPRTEKGLWLALYLPRLPFEALACDDRLPFAVFDEYKGVRKILIASDPARAAGVEPGQSVNAALSICPSLSLEARDPARERCLVERLAAWADRFTPYAVIEDDDLLLLEVEGSLHLFGGIARLREDIRRRLDARGLTALLAAAPTPLASVWLARSGRVDGPSLTRSELAGRLGGVPLESVGWPADVVRKLRGMGITCIGDCLRLPRQGFARRFGVRRLTDLDRALGRQPDPRARYRRPESFSGGIEFDEEEDDRERLMTGCRRLLGELERFLRVRQLEVQRIRVRFFHLRGAATQLAFGAARTGLNADHWFDLLALRFERITLPSPVIAIRLESGRSEPGSPATAGLVESGAGGRPIEHLVERLSARIGEAAVHGVTTVAEHRPQYAWRATPPIEGGPRGASAPAGYGAAEPAQGRAALFREFQSTNRLLLRRPLWMLEEPEPLPVRDGRPLYRGAMLGLEGPERLESGWWDDDGIARDYFVARSQDGVCLWVFRNCRNGGKDHTVGNGRDGGWYLHGMFG